MVDAPRSQLITELLAKEAGSENYDRFSELYGRVAPAVHAWAELRIPRSLRAQLSPDDLIQEVWARAILRLGDFDSDRGRFRHWLFGFARRVLYEALRRLAASSPVAVGDEPGMFDLRDLPDQATTINRRVARNEHNQRLVGQIRELSEDEQRLFILRGLEGLDHEEVASSLGVDTATVRKRWQRLRGRVRESGALDDFLVD